MTKKKIWILTFQRTQNGWCYAWMPKVKFSVQVVKNLYLSYTIEIGIRIPDAVLFPF